jgi:PKD domain
MRSPLRSLSLMSLMVGGLVVGLFLISGPAAVQTLTIDPNYTLVRTDQITRTQFDFTYRAKITNPGPADFVGVTATLTSRFSRTVVVDGSLTFGTIPAGSTVTSSDTFTIRQDRTFPFNPADLVWQVSGTPVSRNTPPVANAGPDQTVVVKQTVTLDGSHSTDAEGDPLQYRWSMVAVPTGSHASLSDPTLVHPTFVVDRPGSYTVQLIVNDGKVGSAPATVTITTTNSLPVAKAGPDQTVFVGTTVQLDGSKRLSGNFPALS